MAHAPGKLRQKPWLLLCLLAALLAAAVVFLALPKPPLVAPAPSQDLRTQAQGLSEITITARLDPTARAFSVTQRLVLSHQDQAARDTLVLRAYPNAFQSEAVSPIATEELYDLCYPQGFSVGALSISSLNVGMNGETPAPLAHLYTDEAKTVLRLRLPTPWLPHAPLVVDASYILTLPLAANRFGVNNGLWALGNAFLIPAVFEDGAYRTDPYYPVGDPFVSDCANYHVTLEAPQGYRCGGSAWPQVTQTQDGLVRYTFDALAVRDFALCLSEGYQQAQAMAGDTLLTAYAVDQAQANTLLRYAKEAFTCFSERFGAYPYPSLTLCQVDFPFGGMEYPSLLMIGSQQLSLGGEDLEWLVAHEVAHQWWYAVVGSDQVNQAWQDEALCEFSLLEYAQSRYGMDKREDLRFRRIESAMRVTVEKGITPGSPLAYFGLMREYSLVVYYRGAALLCALDTAMNGRLDDFLRRYYDDYRFALATRPQFEALLTSVSGEDFSPLIIDYLDTYLVN